MWLGLATDFRISAALLEMMRRLRATLGLAKNEVFTIDTITWVDRRNVFAAIVATDWDQDAVHDLNLFEELIGLLLEIANPFLGGQGLEGDSSEVDRHQRDRSRIDSTTIVLTKIDLDHQLIHQLARGELEITLIPTNTTTLCHLINDIDELADNGFGELANHY